jgi:hypothetical protein
MLLFRATSAGDYVVRATSGAPGQTGKFRIWIGRVVR